MIEKAKAEGIPENGVGDGDLCPQVLATKGFGAKKSSFLGKLQKRNDDPTVRRTSSSFMLRPKTESEGISDMFLL